MLRTMGHGVAESGQSISHQQGHSAWHRTKPWGVYGDTGMREID